MELKQMEDLKDSVTGANGHSGKFMAVTFAASGLLGAAVGLLFAPRKGSEAREKIAGMAGDLKEKTNDLSLDWREKARHWLKKENIPKRAEAVSGPAGDKW